MVSVAILVIRLNNCLVKGENIMSVTTFEGIVDQGQIKLKNGVRLPDNIKVYIVVPDLQPVPQPKIHSPRLAHPEQAADFKMEVTEVSSDAGL